MLEEKKPGRVAEEDVSETPFQMERSSLRHLGMRGGQTDLDWAAIGHQEIHWESKQPEEAKSQEADLQTAQKLRLQSQGQNLDLWSVDRTFGQHQSPQPCESQPNLDELYY